MLSQITQAKLNFAPTLEQVESWATSLEELFQTIARRFARAETKQTALAYLKGLLSLSERKTSWQLAESAGHATPHRMQRLLSSAKWEAEALRQDLSNYIVKHLGHPKAVVVLDDTGFIKKGFNSVGVKRQYSGTAGRVENCQIGVFVAYASPYGHTLLERELYLPKEWVLDQALRDKTGVPPAYEFATKPQLAQKMLEQIFEAQVPFEWVTGDSGYGDSKLRAFLEEHHQPYVLGMASNDRVELEWQGVYYPLQIKEVVANFKNEDWQRVSCGSGSKGPRIYDWAAVKVRTANTAEEGWQHWLLVRRTVSTPLELSYYLVYAKSETTLSRMVAVAGERWRVEECFELAKEEVGLDHYQVRSWKGWYRHVTLAMLALAWLSVSRASQFASDLALAAASEPVAETETRKVELELEALVFSVAEIRQLVWRLVWQSVSKVEEIIGWSWWRRRHQAQAKYYHYKKRLNSLSG